MKNKMFVFAFLGVILLQASFVWATPDCRAIFGPKAKINIQQDKVDLPFEDDKDLQGYWVSVDFINDIETFNPAKKSYPEELFLQEMIFLPEGKILNSSSEWTKNHILDLQDKTNSSYQIKQIDGKTYLFFEWKSGDYVCLGKKPSFYVFRKEASLRSDKIDFPFKKDNKALGKWYAIDFVFKKEDFNPNQKYWKGDLYLKTLTLLPEGKTPMSPAITWTKGKVLHKVDKTASAYEIKKINGKEYMFFEWKSGDYLFRGKAPAYYVLEKRGK